MTQSVFQTQPFELSSDPRTAALVMIGMQRDFVEAEGFGEALGSGASLIRTTIVPYTEALVAIHRKGVMVTHTHGGHRADLSDCPSVKLAHGGKTFIGEPGPMEHVLARGGVSHDIAPELYPMAGEPVIDKPGKGAFYQAGLHLILRNHGIRTLIVCGVTTKVHVITAVREADDRDYRYTIPEDCVGSYFPEFQKHALGMIRTQGAVSGQVIGSKAIIAGLED